MKFKSAEDAKKCVEISEGKDGIFLDKRQLYVTLAIKQGQNRDILAFSPPPLPWGRRRGSNGQMGKLLIKKQEGI